MIPERRTFAVHFSDACTDVLAFLASAPANCSYTINGVADEVAPDGARDPLATTTSAIRTLAECGLVEGVAVEGMPMWRATDAGRTAVTEATDTAPRPSSKRVIS